MIEPAEGDPVSFLGRSVPAFLRLRHTLLAPADERPYREAEWRGTFVVVECGEIELESRDGRRYRLVAGNSLWLAGLPLRSLRNPGPVAAVLSLLSRRSDEFPSEPPLKQ